MAVSVNNDHSNAIFRKRVVFSLGVINNKNMPTRGNTKTNPNIFS